jgi:hypothetical protein
VPYGGVAAWFARREVVGRSIAFYERGLARLEDRWAGTGEPGDRFASEIISTPTISISSVVARSSSCWWGSMSMHDLRKSVAVMITP